MMPRDLQFGFWRKYLFSTDHKVIGVQYALAGLGFLFLGFFLVMMMRWQLAYPGRAMPGLGTLLSTGFPGQMPKGVMTPDFYNSLGAMHGTIMVFLGVVPLGFAAFGNYVMPLQIGAPDMAFPKLNMASFWVFFVGGCVMLASFFLPTGAAKSGWTSYPPLANFADSAPNMLFTGQTFWLIGILFVITSSLLGSVNFITTIVQLRAPGMGWMRLPFFCWTQLTTAYLLLLAFPPMESAVVMQLMDRLASTSFFNPNGLIFSGRAAAVSGGGSPLLWQHLFWFLAHPEVYVLILPALGITAEVVANNTRKPLYGYRTMVLSALAIGFLSFLVWAHHMYLTGMGTAVSAFFQATTVSISVPSVIILTALVLSLWGGSIRFTTPMLFTCAFIPMFGLGGLTGLPLAFSTLDIYLHDTYYIIGHFHYIVAPGSVFAIFAGVYYWFPKATGRMLHEGLGKLHFWSSLAAVNGIFLPMFLQGMAGVHRRWWDGGASYELAKPVLHWNVFMSWSAWILAAVQGFFLVNLLWSLRRGQPAPENPWEATTLEWQPQTSIPTVYRGPYEYSVPGEARDFSPQNQPWKSLTP